MKQDIYKYLKNYSTEPVKIDRLIISAFLYSNELKVQKNRLLKEYFVTDLKTEEYKKVKEFVNIILEKVEDFNFETLIELFEFVISPEDRIINGAIYTPQYIRKYIIDESLRKRRKQFGNLKCADIACGCGGFLYDLAKKIKIDTGLSYSTIFSKNLFGLDIQEYSIFRAKLLLSLLALSANEDEYEYTFNLYIGDTLEFKWANELKSFKGFDIIVGNPPYVRLRNLNQETKKLLKNYEVCKTGLTDLYIPFFQIGVENLNKNGVLGYITMNSFFKSLNGRALREYFQKKQIPLQILDFAGEQVFKSKSTYTCICFIQNKKSNKIEYTELKTSELDKSHNLTSIEYKNLEAHSGWNLKSIDIINQIENTGKPFKELFTTRHGIATLRNKIYIFKPIEEDKNYFYLQNGSLYKIEKKICKDIVNPNKLKNQSDFNSIKEKIIFPYTKEEKPKLLKEKILKTKYPFAYKYLSEKKDILAERDKGEGNYENWYAFGRTQSLEKTKNKLFFPKIANKPPNCVIRTDNDLYYYNGQAIISKDKKELEFIKVILESDIFWFYIVKTSKPYNSNYYSLNGGYINNFGIPEFTESEKKKLLSYKRKSSINKMIAKKYGISLF